MCVFVCVCVCVCVVDAFLIIQKLKSEKVCLNIHFLFIVVSSISIYLSIYPSKTYTIELSCFFVDKIIWNKSSFDWKRRLGEGRKFDPPIYIIILKIKRIERGYFFQVPSSKIGITPHRTYEKLHCRG